MEKCQFEMKQKKCRKKRVLEIVFTVHFKLVLLPFGLYTDRKKIVNFEIIIFNFYLLGIEPGNSYLNIDTFRKLLN